MTKTSLFDPLRFENFSIGNRIVMAPMTRNRATSSHVVTPIVSKYYAQRASAGLIITEGTSPSKTGIGYARSPGIYTVEQVDSWKNVTSEVHKANGRIFLQLMHAGRISHPANKPLDAKTVGPSAIAAKGTIYTDQLGLQPHPTPHALSKTDIINIIEEYKHATKNAFNAGFDGVELHVANGYLPMQFLSDNANLRDDQYGGTITNKLRFVIEILETITSIFGSSYVGIRISPGNSFNDIAEKEPIPLYTTLLREAERMKVSYIHSIHSNPNIPIFELVRKHFNGISIINGGFTYETGQKAIQSGLGDLVSYGIPFISNPDLVEKFKLNIPLKSADNTTFYTPGPKGYIDYE